MKNIDQHTYNDLIAEARQLHEHLVEWTEQFSGNSLEQSECDAAKRAADRIVSCLSGAKEANTIAYQKRIEEALHRVETGAATRMDAIVLRGALS